VGLDPVADGDDHIQVVKLNVSGLGFVRHGAMSSGCPEIPDNHSLIKFAFTENIADMLGNRLLAFTEQPSHVILSQPNRLVFQADIDFDFAIGSLINKNF
jgi:hypothetical protein